MGFFGPGSLGGSFFGPGISIIDPATLSPLLDFQTDTGITEVSGKVSQWQGQGSEAALVTDVGSAPLRPTYNNSDAGYGGQPTLTFDGSANRLLDTSTSDLATDTLHLFAVADFESGVSTLHTLFDWGGGATFITGIFVGHVSGNIDVRVVTASGTLQCTYAAALPVSKTLIEVKYTGTADDGSLELIVDGVSRDTDSVGTDGRLANTLARLTLGKSNNGTSYPFDGTMGRLVAFSSIQSAANVTGIRNWYNANFGTAA